MNELKNKNNFQPEKATAIYTEASTAGVPKSSQEISGLGRPARFIKPVPFNGLLTNKLLTQLPGEDFARLLPYLEPVSLSCGEDLYGFEEGIRAIYFPETAVISHLHVMGDGSPTAAAVIGREGLVGLSSIGSGSIGGESQ